MNCEDFRNRSDNIAESRKPIAPGNLPPDMRSHVEKCAACALYLDYACAGADAMSKARHIEISHQLYERLIQLEAKPRGTVRPTFNTSFPIYILQIVIPATIIWTVGKFMPAPASVLVEFLLIVCVMVLAFEKIARRLVTDRV